MQAVGGRMAFRRRNAFAGSVRGDPSAAPQRSSCVRTTGGRPRSQVRSYPIEGAPGPSLPSSDLGHPRDKAQSSRSRGHPRRERSDDRSDGLQSENRLRRELPYILHSSPSEAEDSEHSLVTTQFWLKAASDGAGCSVPMLPFRPFRRLNPECWCRGLGSTPGGSER